MPYFAVNEISCSERPRREQSYQMRENRLARYTWLLASLTLSDIVFERDRVPQSTRGGYVFLNAGHIPAFGYT
jgi:hypothetical protein